MSDSFHLQQMVTEPTHVHSHGASIIDLAFVSNLLLYSRPTTNSDHNGLLMNVTMM